MKFNDFSKEMQERMCTFPQSVFATINPDDETDTQVIERQNKFLKLPEAVKDKLVSHETASKIKAIGEHYGLSLLQMAPIARVIRSYYFGEVRLEDMARVIEKESKISKEDAENVSKYLADRIIGKSVSPVVSAIKTEKMTIPKALEVYPNIKNQKITSLPIEIEGENVAPTVDNWIKDYYNIVGAGNKDIVKRSSYLYHSRNVKNLSSNDRQKLSTLLKSLDEGSMIDIAKDTREIFFDARSVQSEERKDFGENKKDNSSIDLSQKEKASDADPNHVHGNNLDLGSIHFKGEDKKRGIFNFFSRKKEDNSGLSFSFPQQLSSEKEKLSSGEKNKSDVKEEDFFSKITPIEK